MGIGTRTTLSGTLLTLVVSLIAVGQSAPNIPFTPEGIRSIPGKDICSFEGGPFAGVGVYLDGAMTNSVDYNERGAIIAVFLLSKPTSRCGTVEAALDLTHVIQKGESVEFKCYTKHEGGTTWAKWGHVVGLANNHRGTQRFVKARLAWRVNVGVKRFEPIDKESVTCDTNGYAG
jgi:hypothetical protein